VQDLRGEKHLVAGVAGYRCIVAVPVLILSEVVFVEITHLSIVVHLRFIFAYNDNVPTRSELPDSVTQTAGQLRREISARNLERAAEHEHETTYGSIASVLYREEGERHGNFFLASYRRICAQPEWAQRLEKVYTASSRIARGYERTRGELDCANSSDALLMNIFCHPRTMQSIALCGLLGVKRGSHPSFGERVRTPLRNRLGDRTEIDMHLDDLFVEAKFTETDFQTARPDLMTRYSRFDAVFDVERLPMTRGSFRSYQLLRGVLAADHYETRFAVFCDARRPDLREQWFTVLAAIQTAELRSRMLFITWQEIAAYLPRSLQQFLTVKYGIEATG
jgi:hypothetical protein